MTSATANPDTCHPLPSSVISCWHIHQAATTDGTQYEVRDSRGQAIATGVKSLAHARLIAFAPLLLKNFDLLVPEAERSLHHMLDASDGMLDFEEVADDEDGEWESSCPGAPDFAQWLIDMDELRESVGEQDFSSEAGVQGELQLD